VPEPARTVAAGYDTVADRYAALEGAGQWPRRRRVADLAGKLSPGARVLELGCGNGIPVARDLVDAGFDVTGVDVSPEQIRRAREAVPEAKFVAADMLSVDVPEASFDAVVCLYAIEHVPRERHADVFRRIFGWLRAGGLALLAVEDSDQPGVVADWLGAPMFFSVYPADDERRLAEAAGLDVLEADVEAQRELGRDVPYLWLLVRRPDVRGSTGRERAVARR
jgi:cyclopropane fatty-acyl-phospholipid synthase-like methyltransferase